MKIGFSLSVRRRMLNLGDSIAFKVSLLSSRRLAILFPPFFEGF